MNSGGNERKKQNKCDKKSVSKELIEGIVIRETMKLLSDEKTLDHIAQTVIALFEEENYTLKALGTQLAEKQKSIHNLLSAMEQGIITPSTKERMLELEREKQETEAAIARERTDRPLVTKDFVLFWLSKFQDGDITDTAFCRRLIDTFNSIFLYDDKVVITYNYKGKRKTLKLKDIKDGSDLKESAPPTKPRNSAVFLYPENSESLLSCAMCAKSAPNTRKKLKKRCIPNPLSFTARPVRPSLRRALGVII